MILFGVTAAFLPSAAAMMALHFLNIVIPWNFLVFFVIFFPASIAYSIVRHNLFEADAIIRRTVGYVIVTAVIVGAYALVSVGLNVALGSSQLAQSKAFPILFTLGVILVFNPLRDRIQALVDRLFFRKEYDYGAIVEKVGDAMTSMLDLPQILKQLTRTFIDDMFINTSSVMLLGAAGDGYQIILADGDRKEELIDKSFKRDNSLMEIIESKKKELTKFDVMEDPRFNKYSENAIESFEALHASLIVPLVYQDKVIGSLNLGEKKSGKFYNREDIELLRTLANQGAVAIENARMVEEIVEKERVKAKIMDSFGKYVTSEVRDQILEGRIPMDGELKDVTVLFADLRGFTTLTESTSPKEVVKIINGYFSEMSEAIGKNHGLVLQFIGDEIEAVFGAPSPLEDHPTHAVRAAMAMRERLVTVNEKLGEKGYAPLRHGIGIHTGNVVAANIGSEDRLSYALVGDTVNAASRIQSLNKEYNTDVLISAITLNRLSEYIHGEKLGATTVKGKKEPVEIFKLA
jgi:class 3 adenylate cyclase